MLAEHYGMPCRAKRSLMLRRAFGGLLKTTWRLHAFEKGIVIPSESTPAFYFTLDRARK